MARDDGRKIVDLAQARKARHSEWYIGGLIILTLLATAATAKAQQRVDLPSRPGVTEPIYVTEVSSPKANIILFPGGNGQVAAVRNNFLLRVAPRFVAAGMTVVVFDSPSDQPRGMERAFRVSPQHTSD